MAMALLLDMGEVIQLRQAHYNAQIVDRTDVHNELAILRVRPDHGITEFAPGQYSVMGLGKWEPRLPGCEEEHLEEKELRRIVKRAYSFSCSVLDEGGCLRRPSEFPYFEFYVVLVRQGEEHPPGLTPRLFALRPGDRLFVGPKATGHYTLDGVQPDDSVVLVATGTGEAPHNAMVAHLLSTGHRGRIVTVTCVRQRCDLGYAGVHRQLERTHANYRYLTLTTREPENLDASHHNFIGRRYLQDYFESGGFERDSGAQLDPQRTHVFLCGNPAMIGAPRDDAAGNQFFPAPVGMIEILSRRGFCPDEKSHPGNIHYEKYW
jgi:ferredoxin/flavodoxin---NADP+ reductase